MVRLLLLIPAADIINVGSPKHLPFPSFPQPLPYSRRISAFLPTLFSILLTYNCSVPFCLLMQNVTQNNVKQLKQAVQVYEVQGIVQKKKYYIPRCEIKDTHNIRPPRCRST